jgi:hypothetical protein
VSSLIPRDQYCTTESRTFFNLLCSHPVVTNFSNYELPYWQLTIVQGPTRLACFDRSAELQSKMIFHGSSQLPHRYIKREDYDFSLYATPALCDVGVVGRFAESQKAYSVNQHHQHTAPGNTGSSVAASFAMSKRPLDEDANNAPVKHVKAEHPEEFSNAVKKRLASSTRTGQACDRCKVMINITSNLPVGAC